MEIIKQQYQKILLRITITLGVITLVLGLLFYLGLRKNDGEHFSDMVAVLGSTEAIVVLMLLTFLIIYSIQQALATKKLKQLSMGELESYIQKQQSGDIACNCCMLEHHMVYRKTLIVKVFPYDNLSKYNKDFTVIRSYGIPCAKSYSITLYFKQGKKKSEGIVITKKQYNKEYGAFCEQLAKAAPEVKEMTFASRVC